MANRSPREKEGAKMELRKQRTDEYTIGAGHRVVVHALGASLVFENNDFRAFINPKIADVKYVLNLETEEKRPTNVVLSTVFGIELNLTSTDPNGFDRVLPAEQGSCTSFKLKSYSAELHHEHFDMEYGENGTTLRADRTDDFYVLLVESEEEGKTSYEFYVVERHAIATLKDVDEGRYQLLRIPGVKPVFLEKVASYKDWYGCIVLQMNLIVNGAFERNIFVKMDSPEKKAIPEVLYQVAFSMPPTLP